MQKIYRLASKKSFNYVYRKGEAKFAKHMQLFFVSAASTKIGISVSKKIGKSVVRSKVKRRISEGFRLIIPSLNQNRHYIVVAKQGIEDLTYHEINAELIALLKKLSHIN